MADKSNGNAKGISEIRGPDGDGIGHACDNQDIPAVSAWGLVIAVLSILIVGSITIHPVPRRCPP